MDVSQARRFNAKCLKVNALHGLHRQTHFSCIRVLLGIGHEILHSMVILTVGAQKNNMQHKIDF